MLSVEFAKLNNQNRTLIEIRKKMLEFGEKMKTHILKISPRSQSSIYPLGKMKNHNDFQRCKTQNLKMGFSSRILLIKGFLNLSSYLRSDE